MSSYENNQQITILSIDLHRSERRDHQSQLQTRVFSPHEMHWPTGFDLFSLGVEQFQKSELYVNEFLVVKDSGLHS